MTSPSLRGDATGILDPPSSVPLSQVLGNESFRATRPITTFAGGKVTAAASMVSRVDVPSPWV